MTVWNLKTGSDHDTDSEKYYPKQDPKILNIGQTNGWHIHYKNGLQKNMHERKGRAPNLYIYRAKNKDRNHTISSCEMLQTSDKSTKKPQL